jgi:hypothetical protein
MQFTVEPGKVDVMVGANVQQTASVQLEVTPQGAIMKSHRSFAIPQTEYP